MILTRTPYRVSFFGGGTDYPAWFHEFGVGSVLSTTIDKYCYLACRYLPPFFNNKSRIVWSKVEIVNQVDEIEHPAVREILKFLKLSDGVEVHHYGDLPHMSGMGSSSSFVVGLLHSLRVLLGENISKRQLALDAIRVEQEIMKSSVGCQDQTAAAYGGFNHITFGGQEKIKVQPVSISPEMKKTLEGRLMLYFTGLSRIASEVAAKQIEITPRKERELRTMLGMVDEAQKILGNSPAAIDDFGSLLHETWMLKKGLTQSISTSDIDAIYDRARKAGAIGGKLLGAGGGGFLLLYVKPEDQEKVKEELKGVLHVPFSFEEGGSKLVYSDGS